MFNLSKSVIIVSLAAGLVAGFAVWHFIYRCEDPTCVITYVNLVICLLVFPAFALVTGEVFFAHPDLEKRKKPKSPDLMLS